MESWEILPPHVCCYLLQSVSSVVLRLVSKSWCREVGECVTSMKIDERGQTMVGIGFDEAVVAASKLYPNATGVSCNFTTRNNLDRLECLCRSFSPRLRRLCLSGIADGQRLENLSLLKNLTDLNIGGIILDAVRDGLGMLSGLTALKILKMKGANLGSNRVEFLTLLPHLQSLDIACTRIESLVFLRSLTKLTQLSLWGNDLGEMDTDPIGDLISMGDLDLGSTQVSVSVSQQLMHLACLSRLDVCETSLGDECLELLSVHLNLAFLNLERTCITDKSVVAIAQMSRLENLNVMGQSVSDAGLAHLANCSKLNTLNLASTQVTGVGLAHLAQIQTLTDINLNGTNMTDEDMGSLSLLRNLKCVSMKLVALSDAGVAHLKSLQKLMQLALSDCQITDKAIERLSSVTSLTELKIANTSLTDECIPYLLCLESLESLSLSRSLITDQGALSLVKLTNLQYLNLVFTSVTRECKELLRERMQLSSIG